MKRIVVATDGSAGSALAATKAAELAAATGAHVTYVTVVRGPGYSADPVSGRPPESGGERGAAPAAAAQAREAGASADFQFLDGEPAEAVTAYAREQGADLIVVGSRGLGSVRSLVLGSVSRQILERADRPVLVVK